jgi:hypothetical protein
MKPLKKGDAVWLVMYQNNRACIHHGFTSTGDHLLCGPIVFCCQNALRRFFNQYPDYICRLSSSSEPAESSPEIRGTPGEQIVTWMDAGIQVINFIVCDPRNAQGISAAILSGNQARQALNHEIALESYLSLNALQSIAMSIDNV